MTAIATAPWDMIIAGEDVQSEAGETFETVSPTTNQPIAEVPKGTPRMSIARSPPPAQRSMTDPGPALPHWSDPGR